MRIVAELINAADGITLWTQTFERELKDIFAVQEEIAEAVASSLKMTLLGSDERLVAHRATKNTEAHNAYLLGHYYLYLRISRLIAARLANSQKRSASIQIMRCLTPNGPMLGH